MGEFTHTTGGHLVLWDFGLVIDFPAGSAILIPSALIVHSNTAVQCGGTRYSIVQYVAGGLFRWVENGCMTKKDYLAKCLKEGSSSQSQEPGERWAKAVNMFTHISQLI